MRSLFVRWFPVVLATNLSMIVTTVGEAADPPPTTITKGWFTPGWIQHTELVTRSNSYPSDTFVDDAWFFGQNGWDPVTKHYTNIPLPSLREILAGSDSVLSVLIPEIVDESTGQTHDLSGVTFYYGGDAIPAGPFPYRDACASLFNAPRHDASRVSG